MVLKANDRRTSCPYHDEFRGPRSDYVRQVVEEVVCYLVAQVFLSCLASMDVCKRIAPLRQGCTLNSRRAASPLMWLVVGEERWEAPYSSQGCSP
ncbi:hypothetical protein TNCV_3703551 [Trichonephila clavipes]|nr:hypothetical protein TNCV_3703551 [Trichonephila clavipes]